MKSRSAFAFLVAITLVFGVTTARAQGEAPEFPDYSKPEWNKFLDKTTPLLYKGSETQVHIVMYVMIKEEQAEKEILVLCYKPETDTLWFATLETIDLEGELVVESSYRAYLYERREEEWAFVEDITNADSLETFKRYDLAPASQNLEPNEENQ